MILKARAEADGRTCVWMVDPSASEGAGETVDGSTRYLSPGQELEITLPEVHEASGVVIGEAIDAPETPGTPPSEAAQETPGEQASEGDQGGE